MKNIYIYILTKAIVRIFRKSYSPSSSRPSPKSRYFFGPRRSEYEINFLNEITSVGDS